MGSWSRGRVSLVGDAGDCPGPAVGGGTTVAVVGAYVLAGELKQAGGDHIRAFGNYQSRMREFVRASRSIGPSSMRTLIPRTPGQVWLAAQLLRLVPRLPAGLQRRLASVQAGPAVRWNPPLSSTTTDSATGGRQPPCSRQGPTTSRIPGFSACEVVVGSHVAGSLRAHLC